MITAMLGAAGIAQADASVRDDFDKAIRRIHTLSELHSRLYRDDGFDAVDMRAYLGDICDGLRGAVLPEQRIELECAAAPIRLTIDQAVPLGLIVSELATNAAKYAFPGNRPRASWSCGSIPPANAPRCRSPTTASACRGQPKRQAPASDPAWCTAWRGRSAAR